MSIRIADIMAKRVISAQSHHSVDHVRGIFERNRIHALPILGPAGEARGIVTTADAARKLKGDSPVRRIMTERVHSVPAYNDVSVAARMMRRHKIHHVVVTHERKVIGILSSFDLLKLVEDHRFVMKPGPPARKSSAQKKSAR